MNTPANPLYLVGLVGQHRLGKSTMAQRLADALAEFPELQVLRVNMADGLRRKLNSILPTQVSEDRKNHPLERPTLQYTGEMWRLHDKNYWVYEALGNIHRLMLPGKVTVAVFADAYNLNEMGLMDQLVMVGRARRGPSAYETNDYLAETVRNLHFMWEHPHLVTDVVDGPVDVFTAESPGEFVTEAHLQYLQTHVVYHLNRRLHLLGRPYLGGSDPHYVPLPPDRVTRMLPSAYPFHAGNHSPTQSLSEPQGAPA